MSDEIGGIFSEHITFRSRKSYHQRDINGDRIHFSTTLFLALLLIGSLGILATRLFEITIIKGNYYHVLSLGNRTRERTIMAPRGIVYDRSGMPLVGNIPSEKENATRDYVYGPLFAHVLGYIGEIDPQELSILNASLPDSRLYRSGDSIGKTGIEKAYEDILRGVDGKELVEVDAKGDFIRNLGKIDTKPGKNLNLSLDLGLQQIASSAMEGRKGAVIASIPRTGELLTLYSSPSFDPNRFVQGSNVEGILTNSDMPLFDRAIAGTYPPGSTYKIVNAIAALETGAMTPSTEIEDTGILRVGSFQFPNWYFNQYGKKEGMVDMVKALQRSNDIFFYKAGEATGIETLASWSRKMGLGKATGIDIEGEASGIVPDPAWKEKVKKERWFLGDTYHMAIGQGDLLTTPLQVNVWTNAAANGGKLCRPHLSILSDLSNLCKDLRIKKETLGLVREGMRQACATGGTGWPLFKFKVNPPAGGEKLKVDGKDFLETLESTTSAKRMVEIPTACKTGTAEYGDPKNRTHAWFTVFAPVYHPQISITVLVEGAGEGSSVAAPIAKKMLEEWFGR